MPPTPERQAQQRLSLRLEGLVQGVGLRPFLHRLATERDLRGWVRNGSQGVELELEGEASALTAVLATLRDQPPPRCRIDRLQQVWGAARGDLAPFQITGATGSSGPLTALVSPDLAICRACLAELADPGNRRHRYPFISCTDCGPRYSLLLRLPFEREHTALAAFPPCPACRRDYADPTDRRFHAQTISCPACGPRLRWQAGDEPDVIDQDAISAAAAALRRGAIVAVQGIGGFQLLVDPHNAVGVAELRRRKGRPDKPLALLASADWLERHCQLSALERRLWWSPAAPILLLRRRHGTSALATGVAPESPWLGVMRPASALQQLLLEAAGPVLVATSANRSGEPIAADAETDGALLAHLADGVLHHDLPIVNRSDDSVLRAAAGGPLVLRLGRGLAPLALHHGAARDSGRLALGAQVKGSLALQLPHAILLSPDLGDLGSSAGAEHLHRTVMAWLQRHRLQPSLIACDRHRSYRASQLAAALARQGSVPLLAVQHHHAHLLAVQAEHGLTEHGRGGERIGIAWDGAGLGDDGSLWGGEALAVSAAGYRRLARLRPFRLPGGERALREPRRAALGLLFGAWGPSWRDAALAHGPLPCLEAFSAVELATLEQALLRGFNSPLCSSIGRLFDAVAALLGLWQVCSHEAQAAIALEGLAAQALGSGDGGPVPRYRLPLRSLRGWQPGHGGAPLEWDWRPLLTALLRDRAGGFSPAAIALALHRALADAILALALAHPDACATDGLLLGGGCFQNALLLELSVDALKARGIQAHWPQQLPCNDAALAVGQLLAAASAPTTGSPPGADRHVPRRTG
ncbi:MAG: carbamoyltransferase HypF [Cyanobacteriota bacterium]